MGETEKERGLAQSETRGWPLYPPNCSPNGARAAQTGIFAAPFSGLTAADSSPR
jgi:hypothetical protein